MQITTQAIARLQRPDETDAQWEERIGMTREAHYAQMDPFKAFRTTTQVSE